MSKLLCKIAIGSGKIPIANFRRGQMSQMPPLVARLPLRMRFGRAYYSSITKHYDKTVVL